MRAGVRVRVGHLRHGSELLIQVVDLGSEPGHLGRVKVRGRGRVRVGVRVGQGFGFGFGLGVGFMSRVTSASALVSRSFLSLRLSDCASLRSSSIVWSFLVRARVRVKGSGSGSG